MIVQNACSYRLIAPVIVHYTVPDVASLVASRVVAHQVANVMDSLLSYTAGTSVPLRASMWANKSEHDEVGNVVVRVIQQSLARTSIFLTRFRVTSLIKRLYSQDAASSLRCNVAKHLGLVAVHHAK